MKMEDYLVGLIAIYFAIDGYSVSAFNSFICFMLPLVFYGLGAGRNWGKK
jgi:hypothetical protein